MVEVGFAGEANTGTSRVTCMVLCLLYHAWRGLCSLSKIVVCMDGRYNDNRERGRGWFAVKDTGKRRHIHSIYPRLLASVPCCYLYTLPALEPGTETKPHRNLKRRTPHHLRCQNGQTNKLDHPPPPPYLGEIIAYFTSDYLADETSQSCLLVYSLIQLYHTANVHPSSL